jgi:uncharacterized membrane protein YtjA (UPF0391 family)
MLKWALVFLIAAGIAAVFGYGSIVIAALGIARTLLFVFLLTSLVTMGVGLLEHRKAH